MDFFPSTDKGWDSIYVVVDIMTKQAHLLPTKTSYSASQVACQFIEHAFKHRGLPMEIASDRDAKFVCHFWQVLFSPVGTSLTPNTAYHP